MSQFLGRAKSDHILEKFESEISSNIDKNAILLKTFSDGPNENIMLIKLYEDRGCISELAALFYIFNMTCTLLMEF